MCGSDAIVSSAGWLAHPTTTMTAIASVETSA
jgi:hypothetical protein